MEIIVVRKYPKENYTIGSLFIRKSPPLGGDLEEASWFCNTLEPPIASEAEMRTAGLGKAIPFGTYKLKLSWSQKFQDVLPRLENVPGRMGILIHAGNKPRDSTGCILVGKNTQVGRVTDSRCTLVNLISIIRQALNRGESIKLTISN